MNYAVQRALHARGWLDRFYTDAWFARGLPLAARVGGSYARLAARNHPELRDARVIAFRSAMVLQELRFRLGPRARRTDLPRFWVDQGRLFCELVLDHIRRHPIGAATGFLGFNTTSLEIHRHFAAIGVPSIHCEVGTGRLYDRLWQEEDARWPGWQRESRYDLSPLHDRDASEWESASAVIAASDFAADALAEQGVDRRRIGVVPLIVDPPRAPVDRPRRTGPLRVLFLGRASLMKGLPDFLDAIRPLGSRVEARIVGPIHVADGARKHGPGNAAWIGPVPHRAVAEHYSWADVYVFPTLCDSFGVSQIEAMAYGLPVVSSTNCAAVVEEGISGFRVPIRDPAAITDRLRRFDEDRALLARMSEAAVRRSGNYSADRYCSNLAAELLRLGVMPA